MFPSGTGLWGRWAEAQNPSAPRGPWPEHLLPGQIALGGTKPPCVQQHRGNIHRWDGGWWEGRRQLLNEPRSPRRCLQPCWCAYLQDPSPVSPPGRLTQVHPRPHPLPLPPWGPTIPSSHPRHPGGGRQAGRASHLPWLLARREAESGKLSPASASPCRRRDGQQRAGSPSRRPGLLCRAPGRAAGWGGRQRCQRPGSPEKSSAPACALLLNIHHKG